MCLKEIKSCVFTDACLKVFLEFINIAPMHKYVYLK